MNGNRIYIGDVVEKLKEIESESVQCCVTSPPYWGLRDYGVDGQIGLEKTPEEYISKLVTVFEGVKRVLKSDGVLWLNLGDSYAGSGGAHAEHHKNPGISNSFKRSGNPHWGKLGQPGNYLPPEGLKPKDLCMIPARVAIALQQSGWWLRSEIIWHKPNPMPESVEDRPTKSHEMIYLLTKSAKYYYDADAIMEEATGFDGRKDTYYKGGNKDMAGGAHERWPKRAKSDEFKNNSRNGGGIVGHTGYFKANGDPNFSLKDGVPVRNRRSVWTIPTSPFKGAHFATFPPEIPRICIAAGSKKGDIILDPFFGSGTTGEVALRMERKFIGIDINESYMRDIAEPRCGDVEPMFNEPVEIIR